VTAASSAEPEQLTIDQLASRSGISVRTIRFYAGKGLLPPPKLRGRLGLYGPDHLTRLDLISELTGLGFTLAAIEGFLAALPESIAVEDLVLQRALLAPWVPERLECISRAELDQRAGRTLGDEEIASLATTRAAGPWSADDEALIALADEICGDDCAGDATFAALRRRWNDAELVELVTLVGFYRMVSGFLNTMGVEPEDGLPGWPV